MRMNLWGSWKLFLSHFSFFFFCLFLTFIIFHELYHIISGQIISFCFLLKFKIQWVVTVTRRWYLFRLEIVWDAMHKMLCRLLFWSLFAVNWLLNMSLICTVSQELLNSSCKVKVVFHQCLADGNNQMPVCLRVQYLIK